MDGPRMQEIADQAGKNKALLHYYRNKQKLFEAVFTRAFSQIFPDIQRFFISRLPIKEKLETDRKIIDLKTTITHLAASKLKNGVFTSPEYIRELQAETIAKLNHELHKIQLLEAKEKLHFILGILFLSLAIR